MLYLFSSLVLGDNAVSSKPLALSMFLNSEDRLDNLPILPRPALDKTAALPTIFLSNSVFAVSSSIIFIFPFSTV